MSTVYFGVALFATAVFLLQFVLSFFFASADFDIDLDADGTADFELGDLLSFKGLIHFLIGFAWTMWFCQESNQFMAALLAVAVGVTFVVALGLVYRLALKLENKVAPEKGQDLVGREAEVYLKSPDGSYLVYTSINGSKRELKVYHEGDKEFSPGTIVRISSYSNGKYYIY